MVVVDVVPEDPGFRQRLDDRVAQAPLLRMQQRTNRQRGSEKARPQARPSPSYESNPGCK
jgi:hypothetical protein